VRTEMISAPGCAVRTEFVVAYYECDDDECAQVHIELTTGKDITMDVTWERFHELMRAL